ncbi:hypothetical protein AAVH_19384 [Aphelenchoides avenae]|nr:hypothetical protein AAVH_19384 [Aphelenchus avenae]
MVVRDMADTQGRRVVTSAHRLMPYLRMSCCTDVYVDLRGLIDDTEEDLRGAILDDLIAEQTSVDRLCVFDGSADADVLSRVVGAFKTVAHCSLSWTSGKLEQADAFNEQFYRSLALRGVRRCDCGTREHNAAADACKFLVDTCGIECRLFMEDGGNDGFEGFLLELLEKTSKMEVGTRVNFKFLMNFTSDFYQRYYNGTDYIEAANRLALKYTSCVWTAGNGWIINDLENGNKLEIEQVDKVGFDETKKMLHVKVGTKH